MRRLFILAGANGSGKRRNFLDIYAPLADHWMLYYNGGSDLMLVAHGNGVVTVLSHERFAAFREGLCLTSSRK